jgi:hypothetical protein
VEALAFCSKRELTEIKGMSDAKVLKYKAIGECACPSRITIDLYPTMMTLNHTELHALPSCSRKVRADWVYHRQPGPSAAW